MLSGMKSLKVYSDNAMICNPIKKTQNNDASAVCYTNRMKEISDKIIPILLKYGVSRASLFGSFARGEETEKSDVDILIDLPHGMSLFGFADLKMELEDKLKKDVDLVTYRSIHPLLKDSILKERLFGLTPYEGNHGEDVKECYYYLDATPTQSYLKFLYKYPQEAFPYERLISENKKRSALDREFELYDTGIFDEGKYFDIFIILYFSKYKEVLL